jgi:hypothetical protein
MKKVKQSKYAKKSIDDELKLIAKLKEEDEKLAELMLQSNNERIKKFGMRIAESGRIIEIDEKNGRVKRLNLSHVRAENLTSYRNKQKIAAKFYGNCDELQEKYPDNIFVSLTLTMKHCHVDELSDIINELNHGWTKLINTPEFAPYFGVRGKYYKDCGYFKSLEIASSKEFNKVNPHFHCILHVHKSFLHTKNYVSNQQLLKIWKKSLNISINDDYQISVHIKHIKNNSESSITQQSAYFASYATKTINLSKYNLNFIESYINQIDKRNLIIYSGTMKMINNKKKLIDNNIIDNNEDNNSTYYLYKNNSYYKIDRE